MTQIKTKRERVKFASDNVTGACPEVLNALLKANEDDKLNEVINFIEFLKKNPS